MLMEFLITSTSMTVGDSKVNKKAQNRDFRLKTTALIATEGAFSLFHLSLTIIVIIA